MPRAAKKAASVEFKNFQPYKPKRGEEYMNEPQREHFKALLLAWKQQLQEEVERLRLYRAPGAA